LVNLLKVHAVNSNNFDVSVVYVAFELVPGLLGYSLKMCQENLLYAKSLLQEVMIQEVHKDVLDLELIYN
jgi:hypothetical protein